MLTEGQIVTAIKAINSDWIILSPYKNSNQIFSSAAIEEVTGNGLIAMQLYWRIANEDVSTTSGTEWFIGGTPSGWEGTSLFAVVALEGRNREEADYIGQELLKSALDIDQ